MPKVILFDFDGTIADSFENFLEIADRLADKYYFPKIERNEIEKLREEDARSLLKRFKIPFYKIPFLASDMKKMQQEKIENIHPFPRLDSVLSKLKNSGFTLGIVTSNGKENVEKFLKNNGMNYFSYIHSDTSIFGKDKVLSHFMKKHSLKPSDIVYVGDEIRDIQASKKVGIPIISVTWGFNSKKGLENSKPNFLIGQPKELAEILEKLRD